MFISSAKGEYDTVIGVIDQILLKLNHLIAGYFNKDLLHIHSRKVLIDYPKSNTDTYNRNFYATNINNLIDESASSNMMNK